MNAAPAADDLSSLAPPGVELRAGSLLVDDAALECHRGWLIAEERARADRFHFDRDRRRFTVARATLRVLLAERLGAGDPRRVEIKADANGKPYLEGETELHFNVAHSGEWALYAFSTSAEVGVDFEVLAHRDRVADVEASIAYPDERVGLDSVEDRALGLLRLWTAKEAFLKALGTGLQIEPSRLRVPISTLGGDAGAGEVEWLDRPEISRAYRLHPLPACESRLGGSAALVVRES